MKRFFLFAIFLFAAGCHIPTVPSPDMLTIVETAFSPAVFAQGRKAAVIIEATNDLPSEDPMLNNLTFKNRRTGELFYISTTGREVLMISPGEYDLVILDELTIALHFGLLTTDQVLKTLARRNRSVEVVITGRYAPQALIDAADLVTEMQEIKHYYTKGVLSREGIDR